MDSKSLENKNLAELTKLDADFQNKNLADDGDLLGSEYSDSPSYAPVVDQASSGAAPQVDEKSSQTGTNVIGETTGECETAISETPKSTDQVENSEGHKDSGGSVLSGSPADRVVIGYHPVTEKPVYQDEQ